MLHTREFVHICRYIRGLSVSFHICLFLISHIIRPRPCGGPRGQQTNSAIYLLRATEASRTRAEGSFRFAELFAGLGGFRVALEALGGEAAFASEIDPHACSTYAANFGDVPHGDITEIDADDVPDHDVLTAGFPCQRFSVAGDGAGFSEDRLFFEVIRILEAKQPRLAILENVEGLDGFARRVVVEALALVGYRAEHRVVDALALLPQRRARLYVVARRRDVAAAPFVWPRCLATRDRCASPDAAFGRKHLWTAGRWRVLWPVCARAGRAVLGAGQLRGGDAAGVNILQRGR